MTDIQTPATLIASLPLTRDEVQALRHADTVVFWHRPDDGQGRIDAIKKRKVDGFDDELRKVILVESSITDFDREQSGEGSRVPHSERSYQAVEHFSSYHEVWRTITEVLRAGDVIKLDWLAANNNQNVDEARLTADSLRLKVERDKYHWTFMLSERLCPWGSSARMVQRRR